jgi:hypothetical protein
MYLCDSTRLGLQNLKKTIVLMWRAYIIQAWCMCQGGFPSHDASMLRIFGGVTSFGWE